MKYGFIYLWFDRKHKRYYVGCHWGHPNDSYICSSNWMKNTYHRRPQDFKRRIIKTNISSRPEMYAEELRYLNMIKPEEIKPLNENPRYYNLNIKNNEVWHKYDEKIKTIGEKISVAKTGKPSTMTKEELAERGKAISTAKKGKTFTEEHRQALREAKLGTKLSDEHKANIGKNSGHNKGRKFGPMSEEDKLARSLSQIGKPKQTTESRKAIAEGNSKTYTITYKDGRVETVLGLKQYGLDNGIPYVTLRKSLTTGVPIRSRGISVSI